ncbi:complement factor H-like [Branchiostoma lanceolatum]|uniref:complement factor H-like n=1 Tax=Branchiostoma lanceolatum TaxID=7740 RepID=UPI003453C55A
MKLIKCALLLLLVAKLFLESDAWWWRPRPRYGCSTAPDVRNAQRYGCYAPYTNGERCTYRCHYGYTQVSGSTVRTCSNGRWSGTNLFCKSPMNCPAPSGNVNTRPSGLTQCSPPYTQGEKCDSVCITGTNRVSGTRVRYCNNGAWTGSPLICTTRAEAGCRGAPPPYVRSAIRYGCTPPYSQAESCLYRCRPGFIRVSGSTLRRCSFGHWTGTDLVCRYTGQGTLPCTALYCIQPNQ